MPPSEILFWGLASFLAGIAGGSLYIGTPLIVGVIFALGVAIALITRSTSLMKYVFMFVAATFLGIFYFNFYFNLIAHRERIPFNKKIEFAAVVFEEPRRFETYSIFKAKLLPPRAGTIEILASPDSHARYGEKIEAEGIINPRESPVALPVSAFPKLRVTAEHQGYWIKEKLLRIKTALMRPLIQFMSPDEGALLAGITFGDRSRFSSDFKKEMAASGTTHLVALSGYNIAILVATAMSAFGYILSRRYSIYGTITFVIAFVVMVGAEPSVIRAAIMGFLILFAREAGRIYNPKNSIACAAALMALVNPSVLVYDIGFQLSFVSLLGIVYLEPALSSLTRFKHRGFFGWKENALTTLSAQIAVIPILLSTFGKISLFALLANILILEFVPLTMSLGFLLAVAGHVSYYTGFILVKLIEPLLAYEVWIIKLFSKISFPVSARVTLVISFLYYVVLIAFISWAAHRKNSLMNKK